ncbi:UvrD-helicase domain-containing protein [candidate division KSB1 bacterium]|nr:UvrD-helicase domain-containing protein [candidate division KSB1 bacterium]
MKFVADIHLHSHFSRATSKNLNLEYLSKWAQLKGVNVVGTGDIAHPGWLEEMQKKLDPAEEGLFRLKQDVANPIQQEVPKACRDSVRFMLAGEISNIYKKNDKVRKIHNVVFLPSFDAVEKFQAALEKIGNIRSDGRPILGLDARDLFEIVLETDLQAHLIPAHIWTPWFSLLGSMSGFDSVEECFEDLSPHIFALETGLSSDPPMNWRLSALDRYTLVSNSDAHSPAKLAREANVFNTELSYPAIFEALKSGDQNAFCGTIEFFPEEGKYHYDGHRKCGIRWSPETTHQNDGRCPKCGKPVTVGVMHRVDVLADRKVGEQPTDRHPFTSLIPLPEVLAEIYEVGVNTKRVHESYEHLLSKLGSELQILQDVPLDDLERLEGSLLGEGIRRMRSGEIHVAAGYDGEYGTIRLFNEDDRTRFSTQLGFFSQQISKSSEKSNANEELKVRDADVSYNRKGTRPIETSASRQAETPLETLSFDFTEKGALSENDIFEGLNAEQKQAVQHTDGSLLIVAGPGTGKTRTLAHRLAYLMQTKGVPPNHIVAVTFTNKAAQEMRDRLIKLVGDRKTSDMTIKTFHALGLQILKEEGQKLGLNPTFGLCTEQERLAILNRSCPNLDNKQCHRFLENISLAKNELLSPEFCKTVAQFADIPNFMEVYEAYQHELSRNHVLDYDDLIYLPITLFESHPEVSQSYQKRFQWISVDEYQDINFAQYQFLKHLIADGNQLCAIGDPDQAIYGFRGAKKEFFLKFQQDFPQAKIVKLSKNYRSAQLILDASSQIIAKSRLQIERERVWSDIVTQNKIETYNAATDNAEAEFVVHEIEKMVGGTSYFSLDSGRVGLDEQASGRSFSDFVVLYRLNALSKPLQTALQRSGIPFQTVGERSFFDLKDIKNLLFYLWFVNNPNSNYHLQNLLRMEKSCLSEKVLEKIERLAEQRNVSIWDLLQDSQQSIQSEYLFSRFLSGFVRKLETLIEQGREASVTQLIDLVVNLFYPKQHFSGHKIRKERLNQLRLKTKTFDDHLTEFLETTVLQKEADEYDAKADRVTLMTLHAAKGLEFPVAFIVGCEEALLPYRREGTTTDLDEERRLFYVGITRAKEKLILTHARKRFLFGETVLNSPSRFLSDIENSLKKARKMQALKKSKAPKATNQIDLF